MVDLRLIHACLAFSQQGSCYNAYAKRLNAVEKLVETEKAASLTIAEHWDLVARLHAKCGIYVELHSWSFAVRGVGKMSCYLLGARNCFHIIDQSQMMLHQSCDMLMAPVNCASGRLHEFIDASICITKQSRNGYVIAGQAHPRWDAEAKRPEGIWMTHTKSTTIITDRSTKINTHQLYWQHLLTSNSNSPDIPSSDTPTKCV